MNNANQNAFTFSKKPIQIFILIDLMMLMVFMLMSKPEKAFFGNIMFDARHGYVHGTQISLHNEYGYQVGAYKSKGRELIPIAQDELSSYFSGVGCTGGTCKEVLPKYIEFYEARIYFPEKVMIAAYSLMSTHCTELQCDGQIYIRAGTGEVLLCSRKYGRFYTYDPINRKLIEGGVCQPVRP